MHIEIRNGRLIFSMIINAFIRGQCCPLQVSGKTRARLPDLQAMVATFRGPLVHSLMQLCESSYTDNTPCGNVRKVLRVSSIYCKY